MERIDFQSLDSERFETIPRKGSGELLTNGGPRSQRWAMGASRNQKNISDQARRLREKNMMSTTSVPQCISAQGEDVNTTDTERSNVYVWLSLQFRYRA